MSSRRALLGGLAGLGALAVLGAGRILSVTDQKAIAAVVRKRLAYLRLDDDGVRRFAADLSVRHTVSAGRLRVLAAAGPLYTRLSLSGHNHLLNGIRHGEERVVTLYLLSSDFFRNGRDETRIVRYLGFYDPFQACGNPFARPVWAAGQPPVTPSSRAKPAAA